MALFSGPWCMIMGKWFEEGPGWGVSSQEEVAFLSLEQTISSFFFTPKATKSLPPQVTLLYLGPAQIMAGSHFPIIMHHGPGNTDVFPYSYLPVRYTLWTLRAQFCNITLCTIFIGLDWFCLLTMTTLPLEKRSSIHCTGVWAGPRVGPHRYRKSHPPWGSNLRPSNLWQVTTLTILSHPPINNIYFLFVTRKKGIKMTYLNEWVLNYYTIQKP